MSSNNVATNYLSPYEIQYYNVTEFADSLDRIEELSSYFTTVAEFHQVKIESKLMVGSTNDPDDFFLEVHGQSVIKKYNESDDLLLTIEGSAKIDDKLDVSGESTFNSDVSFVNSSIIVDETSTCKNAIVTNDIDISNNATIEKDLFVFNDTSLNNLYANGSTIHLDNDTTIDKLTVSTTSNFISDASFGMNVFIEDNLDVSGRSDFNLDASFISNVEIIGELDVSGETTLKKLTVNDDMIVNTESVFNELITINNDVSMNNSTLSIIGDSAKCNINGVLTVTNITCTGVVTAPNFQKTGLNAQNVNKFYVDSFVGYQDSSGINVDLTEDFYDNLGNLITTLTSYTDNGVNISISYKNQTGIFETSESSQVYMLGRNQIRNDIIIGNKLFTINSSGELIVTTLDEYGDTIVSFGNNDSDFYTDISNSQSDTSFNLVASQGQGAGIFYDGDITIGIPTHTEADISNSSGRELTIFGDIRVKHGGKLILEDETVENFTIETKLSDIMNIQNYGTGPGITVNQMDSSYNDIVHFQDNSDNVFVIGHDGNTLISGKLHIGIDKTSITGSGGIGNNNTDDGTGIFDNFNVSGISQNSGGAHEYEFYTNGNALIENNLDVSENIYVNDKIQFNTIQSHSTIQVNDIDNTILSSINENSFVITNETEMDESSQAIMYLGRKGSSQGTNSGYAEFSISQHTVNTESPNTRLQISLDDVSEGTRNDVFTITSNGRLGINNTNPDYALDVSGTARIRGDFDISNGTTIFHDVVEFKDSSIVFDSDVSMNSDASLNRLDVSNNVIIHSQLQIFDGYDSQDFFMQSGGIQRYASLQYKTENSSRNFHVSNNTGHDIIFDVSGGESLRIKENCDIDVSTNIQVNGTMTSSSDMRIKTNIKKLSGCLDKLDEIHGYSYNRTDLIDNKKTHIGVIAQDIEKVYPEMIETSSHDIKQVNYNSMIAVLVECVKELKDENKELRDELSKIKDKLNS